MLSSLCAFVGNRGVDDGYGYGQQPSSARASVASSEGFGPNSSRSTRDDAFGGGRPLWPLSVCVCLCVGSTRLLGLSVCSSAYLCLSASHRQAHIKTTKQTAKQAMFACLLGGLDVCLHVWMSVTTQPVSEICIQRLNCSSFAYPTYRSVFA